VQGSQAGLLSVRRSTEADLDLLVWLSQPGDRVHKRGGVLAIPIIIVAVTRTGTDARTDRRG